MRRLILILVLGAFGNVIQTAEAKSTKALFRSITFDDGTTLTEAVDFTNDMTKTQKHPKSKQAAQKKTQTKQKNISAQREAEIAREEEGLKRIGRIQECVAELNGVSQPEDVVRKRGMDYLKDKKDFNNRYNSIFNVFFYLVGNEEGAMAYLFKKYGYPAKYSERFNQIQKWDSFQRRSVDTYTNALQSTVDEIRGVYMELITDLVKENMFEHGAMSEYEQLVYKAERCKSLANGKDADLIKVRVQEMAETVDKLWNNDYAWMVRDLKRGIKHGPVNSYWDR